MFLEGKTGIEMLAWNLLCAASGQQQKLFTEQLANPQVLARFRAKTSFSPFTGKQRIYVL